MTTITEAEVEHAALDWLAALGWQVARGPEIGPDGAYAERDDYGQVALERRLRDALAELNPGLPASALDDAYRKLTRPEGSTLEARNRAFHRYARRWRDGGASDGRWRHSRGAGEGH